MTEPHVEIDLSKVDKAEGADRLSAILLAIAAAEDRDRISIGDLLEALKRRALGALMFIFAIITALPMPPGVSAIVGAPLVFLSAQLMLGMNAWLPRIITDRSLSRVDFHRVMKVASPWLARAEGIMKPRFEFLAKRPAVYFAGFVAFVMSLLVLLPIPGANMAPSIAICIIALGLLERDGIWIVLGALVGIVSTVILAGIYWVLISWTISIVMSFFGWGASPPPLPPV
ncbi:exopolysaccharide biosynthesis protein [Devosia sp. CN2-171]|uniref:exopolysaccharide biosynthesis protein n=1 Tax=Devosia sp. CN2-171 TaxID=3400909 RepID=UPI003BF8A8C4